MDIGFIFQILVAIAIVGVICWAIRALAAYLPGPLPVVIQVFVVLFFCLWLLSLFGGFGEGGFIGHRGHISGPCG